MSTRVPRGQLEFIANRLSNMTSFPPLCEQRRVARHCNRVLQRRTTVSRTFLKSISLLRRRSEQRLTFPHVPCRTHAAVERQRRPQLHVGFRAATLLDELLRGA